jgi:hypothetical protein
MTRIPQRELSRAANCAADVLNRPTLYEIALSSLRTMTSRQLADLGTAWEAFVLSLASGAV